MKDGTEKDTQTSFKNSITLGARILALCDALDAMASKRPYRKALSWDFIETELSNNFGTQFDPELQPFFIPLVAFWRENYETESEGLQVA